MGDSLSNGEFERAIREGQGKVWSVEMGLERRIKGEVPVDSELWS